ncbi:aldo/keto reductase [Streptomyces hygroscopicus]|uniref:aldo/keto reductase n=1 Tax=Streptomyces hygroscopicus TaxID=1912 RepID=UPI0036760E23
MSLPTIPLGRSGMNITRVGLGTWAFGGRGWHHSWGAQDDEDSVATIRHAVELGINWVDTAPVYGFGHAESVVARALAGIPEADRPYVFTKCGLVWDGTEGSQPLVGASKSLRREVEGSLRRLRSERIDLYQTHWPPQDGTPPEEYWGTLLDLRAEGKIRAAGVCNHSLDQLRRLHTIGRVDSSQPPFSALQRAAADHIAWCGEKSVGTVVYSPLRSGLLSGKFTAERAAALSADDWRSRDPAFHGARLRRALAVAEGLRSVADRHGVPLAAAAVAWTLSWRGVTGAIVGARGPDQIADWLGAAALVLTDEDLNEVATVIERAGAGDGPARPAPTPV